MEFHPAFGSCRDCHKDRHGAQFAGAPHENRCERCHVEKSWRAARYGLAEHQKGRFALLGAHGAVACGECHKAGAGVEGRRYHFAGMECRDCHEDPHRMGQAVAAKWACAACHTTRIWKETGPFDHAQTAYGLTGKHRGAACTGCHRPAVLREKRLVTFTGTTRACGSCHGDAHDGQFAGKRGEQPDCGRCHETANWRSSEFDHARNTSFQLTGAHERVPCRMCHPKRGEVEGRAVIEYRGTPRACEECHR
jgi:hypothetical protein